MTYIIHNDSHPTMTEPGIETKPIYIDARSVEMHLENKFFKAAFLGNATSLAEVLVTSSNKTWPFYLQD